MSSTQDQGTVEHQVEDITALKRIRVGGIVLPTFTKVDENPRNQVQAALSETCSNYGRVKDCRLYGKGRFLNAIVTFESHEDAANAILKLQGR